MTNREYLKKELPLWLFNKLVPNSLTNEKFTDIKTGRNAFCYADTKNVANMSGVTFGNWANQEQTINDIFKKIWKVNKDFLFPCTVEEALSILELVEPEFYQFFTARMESVAISNRDIINKWFHYDSVFGSCIDWYSSPEDGAYWANKKDFSLSPQWIAEQTVANKEPKTIGEWLDLPENSLIKEIAEFDYTTYRRSLSTKRNKECDTNIYFTLPTSSAPFTECNKSQSFQPYIDWYNNHPQNPKNVTPAVALKDVREIHTIEWWRDQLAKTDSEVAQHLWECYVFQNRTNQTPEKLYGCAPNSFLGGITWSAVGRHFGISDDPYGKCERQESFQPLKEALAAKKPTVIIDSVDSVNSQMKGATFPCTVQERLDWMKTQPELKPVAEYIERVRRTSLLNGNKIISDDDAFTFWSCSDDLIDRKCHRAKSWKPFFDRFPHLRVKTVKPVELKKINEHRQLLVECANIKEVKLLLKHINQESAFTHSARLVVFYDLDERKAYHVGNTKKSQWRQIKNKVHKKVTLEQFLAEVPMVNLAADRKPRLGASERKVTVTEIRKGSSQNIVVKTSSWFEDVPVETKVNTKSWFD